MLHQTQQKDRKIDRDTIAALQKENDQLKNKISENQSTNFHIIETLKKEN